MSDLLKKYLFADRTVRIESVNMAATWQAAQAHQQYPDAIARLLGELVAASTLLAATLKFDGSLLLQMQGDGAIALMVAECRADLSVRATVKLRNRPIPEQGDLQSLLNPNGGARFIVVLDPPRDTPGRQAYQGIVPLEGETIAQALEHYMLRSEQLTTRIWLAADKKQCAGLLLQRMPGSGGVHQTKSSHAEESWQRALALGETLTSRELLHTNQEVLLERLFWEESLLGFEPQAVTWQCSCTSSRVTDMLKMLGRAEVEDIIAEQGKVEVACEFCGKPYIYDPIDAMSLFEPLAQTHNKTLH
jgi:molecular chaperone Hsp33